MNPITNTRNQMKMNERELEMGLSGTKNSWHMEYKDSAWIFIGGMPYELSEGDMICMFSQYGEVVHVNLVRDHNTGKSRGFGFLCYEDQRSTNLAVDNLNAFKILNRLIRVDHVHKYKLPKDLEKLDDDKKRLFLEGCAPKEIDIEEEKSSSEEDLLPIAEEEKKKKKKRKKTKKKKKKRDTSEDSDFSSSDSEAERKKKKKKRKKRKERGDSSSSESETESRKGKKNKNNKSSSSDSDNESAKRKTSHNIKKEHSRANYERSSTTEQGIVNGRKEVKKERDEDRSYRDKNDRDNREKSSRDYYDRNDRDSLKDDRRERKRDRSRDGKREERDRSRDGKHGDRRKDRGERSRTRSRERHDYRSRK